jgi:hypothetical protein
LPNPAPAACFGVPSSIAIVPALRGLAGAFALVFAGCASFPSAAPDATFSDGLTADGIFARCLEEHGGDVRTWADDLNFSIDGEWNSLIQRIQPLVTDADWRVRSQERYLPARRLHVVRWEGPAGTKQVSRTPDGVEVYYNGVRETDEARLQAAAMTADALQLFHLGPSFLAMRNAAFERIPDAREGDVTYHRLRTVLRPGFGFSEEDKVVLWIDPQTWRLFRVHLTVDGVASTRGAHVDTTFYEYRRVGRMLVPVRLNERVRAPLPLNVHRWWMTGADFNRGWTASDVAGANLTGKAAAPAVRLE